MKKYYFYYTNDKFWCGVSNYTLNKQQKKNYIKFEILDFRMHKILYQFMSTYQTYYKIC